MPTFSNTIYALPLHVMCSNMMRLKSCKKYTIHISISVSHNDKDSIDIILKQNYNPVASITKICLQTLFIQFTENIIIVFERLPALFWKSIG